MYKIFLDKSKTFQCNVNIEGASLDKSEARLLLETKDYSLAFKGKINLDGTVKIPISKLKGILEKNETGKISLEIIAEDTVFVPWISEYQADVSKKVKVSFDRNLSESINEPIEKPKVSFSIVLDETDTKHHSNEIFKIFKKYNKKNLNKERFNLLVENYCVSNHINDTQNIKKIKRNLLNKIQENESKNKIQENPINVFKIKAITGTKSSISRTSK